MAAVGILVVALDLNIESVDLLFDPVGYVLVVLGVDRPAARHAGLRLARAAAVVGLVASLFTALLRRTETVTTGDVDRTSGGGITSSTTRVVQPLLPSTVEAVSRAVFVIGVCTALLAVAGDPKVREPARMLRVALPAVSLMATVLALLVGTLR